MILSYLEYKTLNEVYEVEVGKKGHAFPQQFAEAQKLYMTGKYIIVGNHKGYDIMSSVVEGTHTYYFIVDHHGKVSMFVSGDHHDNTFRIIVKAAEENNPFPMVELYTFLIKDLNLILSTSEQSIAGRKVWAKLARVPGIKIHGWIGGITGTPVNISLNKDQELVYAHSDIDGTKYRKPTKGTEDFLSSEEIESTILVAHKKG